MEVGEKDEKLLAPSAAKAFRIKEILVPIDFSDCSEKALRYAIALAKEHKANLTLLHVVFTPVPIGEDPGLEYLRTADDQRKAAQRNLSTLAAAEVHGAEIIARSLVRTGSPTNEILGMAATIPADIIVISTHGHTGLKHALLGSITEHVVRRAPCPVLVVRESEHECLAG